jgi:hypothetical protein
MKESILDGIFKLMHKSIWKNTVMLKLVEFIDHQLNEAEVQWKKVVFGSNAT